MYIVAIAWLFVTLLMALTEASVTAGVLSFAFYGLLPLALFLWLVGTPQRRRNRAAAAEVPPENLTGQAIDQVVREPNRRDAGADQ